MTTAKRAQMPAKGNTPHRTIRIDDATWHAAQTLAATQGRNLSDIIRTLLKQWTHEEDK